MPTIITHAAVGLALGYACRPEPMPRRFRLLTALAGTLPDLDSIGLRLGIPYGHLLGHRGLTHGIPFAIAAGVLLAWLALRGRSAARREWLGLALLFGVIVASHGLLDSCTDGGRGVALLSPFTNERFFSPWRPLRVAPIGLGRFVSGRGLVALKSELRWLGAPLLLLLLLGWLRRGRAAGDTSGGAGTPGGS